MDETTKLKKELLDTQNRLKKIEGVLFGFKDDNVFRSKIQNILEQASVGINFVKTTDEKEITISGGVIDVTQSYHTIETEGAAATDDINTINAETLEDNTILILRATSSTRTVVLKDDVDNLRLAGDCTLDHSRDTITLIGNGGLWYELARSNNA